MHEKQLPQWVADLSLLMVTAIWGTTFVVVKNAIAEMTPMYFLALRFSLAALVLFVIPGTARGLRQAWRRTLLPGGLLAMAYLLQTYGLIHTSASRAGFITGLSVILVPLFVSLMDRRKPSALVLTGALISTTGLSLMSGGGSNPLNIGDFLVMGCAVGFALQIIVVGRRAGELPPLSLTLGMLGTAALLFWPGALQELFYHGAPVLPSINAIMAVLMTAIMATSLAFYLQCRMQRFTTPSHTALIFSAEPVFAAVFAFLLAGEILGPLGIMGGILIVLGIVLVEAFPMLRGSSSSETA